MTSSPYWKKADDWAFVRRLEEEERLRSALASGVASDPDITEEDILYGDVPSQHYAAPVPDWARRTGRLLAFVGYKGTGKSTLTNALLGRQYQADGPIMMAQVLPMAGPLKDGIKALWNRPEAQLSNAKVKAGLMHPSKTVRVRWALEAVGNLFRDADPDFWVNLWAERYDAAEPCWPVIVDDVNFPNEVRMLKDKGALVVYVSRLEVIRRRPWEGHNGGPPLASDLGVKEIDDAGLVDYRLRLDDPESTTVFCNQVREWFLGGNRPAMADRSV